MTKTRKMWAIVHRDTKEFFGLSVTGQPEGAEFCNSYQAEIWPHSLECQPWLSAKQDIAELILKEEVLWYNSGLTTPMVSDYYRKHGKVVEVTLTWEE